MIGFVVDERKSSYLHEGAGWLNIGFDETPARSFRRFHCSFLHYSIVPGISKKRVTRKRSSSAFGKK